MPRKMDDHLKEKGSYFCSVTHDLALAQEMIKTMPDFTYWAYIYHDSDTDEGSPHYHFLIRHNGSRSVWQIADKLGISGQYVQVCRKVVAFRRYMLHLDSDDKRKYSIDDVFTNNRVSFQEAIAGNQDRDVYDLYKSYRSVSQGKITVDEFIQQNYIEFSKMAFSQKIKIFEILLKSEHGTT